MRHETPSKDEIYPQDISPPAGTQYPCELTPLPKALLGIPEGDRAYINRTYTRVLRATQAKLLVLKALYDKNDIPASQARYDRSMEALIETLRNDEAPDGLEPFRDDLVAALDLQRTFFRKRPAFARKDGRWTRFTRFPRDTTRQPG